MSFRREKHVPRGGPDGGDGGDGGDVIVKANPHMRTLLDFRYQHHFVAGRGGHGKGANKTGKRGQDKRIRLPVGTVVVDLENKYVLADLTHAGQKVIIAHGGKGGRGNARFATATKQTPRYGEPGGKGEERQVSLELKLIADVGLVGLPNAGKSTLLSRISAAKPKIADYPFTTLVPNLGIVRVAGYDSFVVADIPGLIEGAHDGKGLGIRFLRHIERTKILAILLDISSPDIRKDFNTLMNELKSYSEDLFLKPKIVVLTKTDLGLQGDTPAFCDSNGVLEVCTISSVSGEGIESFKTLLFKKLEEVQE